mmetsp:Transcript_13256/g.35500  ORF Transcript_13256/g.35500 Transcript_13256/m.35500 type:complete len:486 (-) Transcript_13256:123-1580(-)
MYHDPSPQGYPAAQSWMPEGGSKSSLGLLRSPPSKAPDDFVKCMSERRRPSRSVPLTSTRSSMSADSSQIHHAIGVIGDVFGGGSIIRASSCNSSSTCEVEHPSPPRTVLHENVDGDVVPPPLPTRRAQGRRQTPADGSDVFAIGPDVVEIIFVRHGLSLNNMIGRERNNFTKNIAAIGKIAIKEKLALIEDDYSINWKLDSTSGFKSGYQHVANVDKLCGPYGEGCSSSLVWEIKNMSRDCLLHNVGEEAAIELQRHLHNVLPEDLPIAGFFTSPLRRTIETLIAAFSDLILKQPTAVVGVQPWIHERYASDSDLGHDGAIVAKFVDVYLRHRGHTEPRLIEVCENLKAQLIRLGNWVQKYAATNPSANELPELHNERSTNSYPLYPRDGRGRLFEPEERFQKRMNIVRQWLTNLRPGERYVLVAHGEIAKGLFQRKLNNLAVVVAHFRPATADPCDAEGFFHEVVLARDKWFCSDLEGWATGH